MAVGFVSLYDNYGSGYGYETYSPYDAGQTGYTDSKVGYADDKTGYTDDKKSGKSSPEECETCKHRKYIDGSDEANVSFKTAAHVSPEAAASAVRAHEGMHVSNAYDKAATHNGKVINASVSIHTSVCPECGRSYVSGGTTHTQIKYYNESNPYQQELKSADATKYRGANVDLSA